MEKILRSLLSPRHQSREGEIYFHSAPRRHRHFHFLLVMMIFSTRSPRASIIHNPTPPRFIKLGEKCVLSSSPLSPDVRQPGRDLVEAAFAAVQRESIPHPPQPAASRIQIK
jgi:hypothetical protein